MNEPVVAAYIDIMPVALPQIISGDFSGAIGIYIVRLFIAVFFDSRKTVLKLLAGNS